MEWKSSDGSVQEVSNMQIFYSCRKILKLATENGGKFPSSYYDQIYVKMVEELTKRGLDRPVSITETWEQMITRKKETKKLDLETIAWIDQQFTF